MMAWLIFAYQVISGETMKGERSARSTNFGGNASRR
jgi:hypothetical protein